MKVVVAGYGVEGKASREYYMARGDDVVIADERDEIGAPAGAAVILGPGAFGKLGEFDLIVRSPGVSPEKLPYPGKVWSATNEFFARCSAPIIGVTGTKGKGTTASLIAAVLQASGKTVHLIGNIGVPALEELPKIGRDDIVVYELSSFQLWDAKKSPHTAVVLMIEPDHLDVHTGMDDYVGAKANIRRFQEPGDNCFYHPSNPLSQRIAMSSPYKGQAKRYGVPEDGAVYAEAGQFMIDGEAVCPTSALQLPGGHNIENACAAISAALPFVQDYRAIETGLRAFGGLEHRLKFVGEVNGVKFYDDSIATTPGSAVAALRSFDQPKAIILGGSDKGADYNGLIEVCRDTGADVIAIGQTGSAIARLCREQGVPVRELGAAPMDEVVKEALAVARPESVVILSPASASFDMYKNYGDRGNQFIAAVKRREGNG